MFAPCGLGFVTSVWIISEIPAVVIGMPLAAPEQDLLLGPASHPVQPPPLPAHTPPPYSVMPCCFLHAVLSLSFMSHLKVLFFKFMDADQFN